MFILVNTIVSAPSKGKILVNAIILVIVLCSGWRESQVSWVWWSTFPAPPDVGGVSPLPSASFNNLHGHLKATSGRGRLCLLR